MVKISVIMPVFNDELYLEEAIESVVNQTLKDIEIVCVNDGSSDNSLAILNYLQKKYDFIKIISQENQGVAVARNEAMDIAEGEYLAFLDSDDIFMDEDALEKLYSVAKVNNANMVSGNLNIMDINRKFSPITFMKYYEKEEVILPENYGIPFSFTKAIFKRKFLMDNNIYFPLLTKGEDPVFLAEILSKLNYVYAVPTDVYAYRYIDGSVKYNSYKNYYDQVMHYKLVFEHMSDPKFSKVVHEFKYQLICLVDFLGEERSEMALKAIRDVFHDNSKILRQCEEYFYFKYKNNKKLSNLVDFEKYHNKPLISVIVPIYNDVANLNSLKSILNQSLKNIEVICLYNRLNDNSIDILNDFSKDKRVKIYNLDNKEYDYFKNFGLKKVNGEYIYFFEVGTKLPKNSLEHLYKNAIFNDSDIVLCKSKNIDDNLVDINKINFDLGKTIKDTNFNIFSFDYKDNKEIVFNSTFTLCNKLYKKEFLDSRDDFIFDMDVAFDDVMFHIKTILNASRISYTPHVNFNNKFYSQKYYNSFIALDILKVNSIIEKFLMDNNYFMELFNEFNKFKFIHMINHLSFVNDENYFVLIKNDLLRLNFIEFSDINQNLLGRFLNILKSASFDEFKQIELKKSDENIKKDYKKLQNKQNKLIKNNKQLKNDINNFKKVKEEILTSTSWKVTSPIRNFKNSIKNKD